MAIALVAHVSANSTGSTTVTSSAIDTTGATLLVANVSYFNLAQTAQLTDSYKNTWVPLPDQFQTDTSGRLFYSSNPTVGSGHTFTLTNGAFSAVCVAAFSGVTQLAPLDVSAGAHGSSTSASGGSVTPNNANSLVISGCTVRNTANISSVGGGFTVTDNVSNGSVIDSALAYLIQTSIVAANPTWAMSSGTNNYAVTNAVFIAGSVIVPSTPALVASVDKQGTGTFTSSAIDTTGATILFFNQTAFTTLGTVSDSKGNTWLPLTGRTNGTTLQKLWYAKNPIVGAGHTFTVTSGSAGSLQAAAFSGVDTVSPFDVEAGTTGSGDAQPGSVTPAGPGSLLISALAYTNSSQEVLGIDADFKIIQLDPPTGAPSSTIGGAIAFLAQGAAAAKNPKWYFSGSSLTWAGDNAVFKTAAVPGNVTAVAATATALMPAPAITAAATVPAVAMTASAQAVAPFVTGGATISAVAMTATAQMIAPLIGGGATILAAVMTAFARMIAPLISAGPQRGRASSTDHLGFAGSDRNKPNSGASTSVKPGNLAGSQVKPGAGMTTSKKPGGNASTQVN